MYKHNIEVWKETRNLQIKMANTNIMVVGKEEDAVNIVINVVIEVIENKYQR